MQHHPDLLAFLALEANRVTGMMIVSSTGFCGLSAGTNDAMRALVSRGNADFTEFVIALEHSRLEGFSSTPRPRAFHRVGEFRKRDESSLDHDSRGRAKRTSPCDGFVLEIRTLT
ncbi:MAG: hypothetical protein HC933_01655 [Pleurocapsa sp. SU_196_0]|nr:hypothetical protein [Pleurocapsa sp. SU_196_0]